MQLTRLKLLIVTQPSCERNFRGRPLGNIEARFVALMAEVLPLNAGPIYKNCCLRYSLRPKMMGKCGPG